MSNNPLTGKLCLITGSAGGLGQELARSFYARGCHLLLTGRSARRLEAIKKDLELASPAHHSRIEICQADLCEPEGRAELQSKALSLEGGPDILVNCAGMFLPKSLVESTEDDFERMMTLNLRVPFYLARAFVPAMLTRGWGRIVNIGSSSAYEGFAGSSLYCASKHGLLGLSRALSAEFPGGAVRTFCISPGSIKTAMGKLVPGQDFESFLNPQEVAEYVLFVVSFQDQAISEEIRINRVSRR